MDPLLSIPEAARAAGASARAVRVAVEHGHLPAVSAGSELYVEGERLHACLTAYELDSLRGPGRPRGRSGLRRWLTFGRGAA